MSIYFPGTLKPLLALRRLNLFLLCWTVAAVLIQSEMKFVLLLVVVNYFSDFIFNFNFNFWKHSKQTFISLWQPSRRCAQCWTPSAWSTGKTCLFTRSVQPNLSSTSGLIQTLVPPPHTSQDLQISLYRNVLRLCSPVTELYGNEV